MSFTPGPWEVNDTNRQGDLFIGVKGDINNLVIANMIPPFIDEHNVAANARLIAASPKMLAAIQGALRIKELWAPSIYVSPEHHDECQALGKMLESFEEIIREVGV